MGRPRDELALAFDVGLAVLVLGLAVWTIAARDTFAAVVGFVAYGLLLALVWVRLAAPDVALTEAAIGSGVTGGLLLGASARLRPSEALADGAGPRAIPATCGRGAVHSGDGGARGDCAAVARARADAALLRPRKTWRRPASAIPLPPS